MHVISAYISLVSGIDESNSDLEAVSIDTPVLCDPEETGCVIEHAILIINDKGTHIPYLVIGLSDGEDYAVPLNMNEDEFSSLVRYLVTGGRIRITQHEQNSQSDVILPVEVHGSFEGFVDYHSGNKQYAQA